MLAREALKNGPLLIPNILTVAAIAQTPSQGVSKSVALTPCRSILVFVRQGKRMKKNHLTSDSQS
jgi:hypothetical protein